MKLNFKQYPSKRPGKYGRYLVMYVVDGNIFEIQPILEFAHFIEGPEGLGWFSEDKFHKPCFDYMIWHPHSNVDLWFFDHEQIDFTRIAVQEISKNSATPKIKG